MCLLSVRCINLVVLLHETIALNAIYNHCVFRNGSTNIQKYFRKTKIYRRVFIMARSAEIVNLESLRRIGTAKITEITEITETTKTAETTETAETTKKLGYQKKSLLSLPSLSSPSSPCRLVLTYVINFPTYSTFCKKVLSLRHRMTKY